MITSHRIIYIFFVCLISPSSSAPVRTPTVVVEKEGVVGVTYRPGTPDISDPKEVVEEGLSHIGVPKVRLIDPDAKSISAFEETGIDINISLEDLETIEAFAGNESNAVKFLAKNVVPFVPKVHVSTISVGYGILATRPAMSTILFTAMINVDKACRLLNLKDISVTTSHFFETIINPVPPSSAEFNISIASTMKQLINFTASTGGSFETTLYPFNLFLKRTIPGLTVPFMKFEAREDQYLIDPVTKLKYRNLYDMMVDAVIVAVAKMGYPTMPIVVSATGWPSNGDTDIAPEATFLNAAEYNQRLVIILNMRRGSPLRPKVTPVTYIHGLFDDPSGVEDSGQPFDDSSGIWENDMTTRYTLRFRPKGSNSDARARGVSPVFIFCGAMLACLAVIIRLRK